MSVSDLMPKYAEAVMHTPAMITSTHSAAVLPPSSSFATGMANMAIPTPNQPICVNEIIALGRYEPFAPKALRASRSRLMPVSAPT